MGESRVISVVVACYNEMANIIPMYDRIVTTFASVPDDFELIFVDNASTDESLPIYEHLAKQDIRVKTILMSRNFGSPQPSHLAGMAEASGDAVVLMDGDLQDPPELIISFIKEWSRGFQVVYAVKSQRGESFIRRVGYACFYRIMRYLSFIDFPADAGEFGLMDRRVVDHILALPEKDVFLRGLRAWVGFRQTGISFKRPNRQHGKTSFNLLSYLRLGKDAIVNFSYRPLEYVSSIAIGSAFLTGIASCFYIYFAFTTKAPRGFFTLLMAILFFGTLQLIALGVIAEYMITIFREVKARPPYIVDKIIQGKKEMKK